MNNVLEEYRMAYHDLENTLYNLREEMDDINEEIKNLCLKFLLESRIGKRDKDIFKTVFKKYLP